MPKICYGHEVFTAIDYSGWHTPGISKIVLGDSVATQLFYPKRYQFEKPDWLYLTSNQAVTPMGNNALLKNAVRSNPQIKEVYYVIRPDMLKNDGSFAYTFHYLLFPFSETGLLDLMDEESIVHLERRFGTCAIRNTVFRRLLYRYDWLYEAYMNRRKRLFDDSQALYPESTIRELMSMELFCMERGIVFRLVAPPMKISEQDAVRSLVETLAKQTRLDCLSRYADSFTFLPDDLFRDKCHLKSEVVDSRRNEFIGMIFTRAGIVHEADEGSGD